MTTTFMVAQSTTTETLPPPGYPVMARGNYLMAYASEPWAGDVILRRETSKIGVPLNAYRAVRQSLPRKSIASREISGAWKHNT